MKDLKLVSLVSFSFIKILIDQFICCIYSFSMFELPSFNNNVLLIMLIILLLISLGSHTAINEFKYYGFSGPRWTSVVGDQSRTQILPCNCNYNRKRSGYETKTSHYLSPEGGGEDFNRGSPTKAWRTIIKATCTLFILDTLK